MKKLIISIFTLAILTGVIYTANAAVTNPIPGKITANATESKNVAPDTATISFTIEATDKNSQKAAELNEQKVKVLVDIIKKSLAANESIKTTNYDLHQNYEYNNIMKKNIASGYTVTNTLNVTLKDTAKTGKIIDLGIKNGASAVSNLSFTLESTDKVCKELTAKAVAKAKEEAMNVLAPLGQTINSIHTINYSCNNQMSIRPYRNYLAKAMATADSYSSNAGATIEQGESKVEASVTIVFTIK